MNYLLPELNHTDNQQYIIYGTGEAAKQYFSQIKSRYGENSVIFFLETNPTKNEFMGKNVFDLSKLETIDINRYKYIVTSFASTQVMIDKLVLSGIHEKMIIKPIRPLHRMALREDIETIRDICFYPEIIDEAQAQDLQTRITWYIPKTKECSTKIHLFSKLKSNIMLKSMYLHSSIELNEVFLQCDIILVWNKNNLSDDILENHRSKIYCVDPTFYSTVESSLYRTLYYYCLDSDTKAYFQELSKNNYASMLTKYNQRKKAYVFGTGPSLEDAFKFDFSDGFNIICNSTVKNNTLLKHIRPDLLVFADPVFHFSPCEYARKFRHDSVNVIKEYDCYCLIPDFTVPLMIAHYPEIENRIIGIPFSRVEEFNFPQKEKFYIKSTANILTLFMLPIASTVASDIYILGCDGRQKHETYFWKHNTNAQYGDLMKTVFDMHPSFFRDRVYHDYYDEHCKILKQLIEYGEAQGKKYYSLTPSYIPVLEERMVFN